MTLPGAPGAFPYQECCAAPINPAPVDPLADRAGGERTPGQKERTMNFAPQAPALANKGKREDELLKSGNLSASDRRVIGSVREGFSRATGRIVNPGSANRRVHVKTKGPSHVNDVYGGFLDQLRDLVGEYKKVRLELDQFGFRPSAKKASLNRRSEHLMSEIKLLIKGFGPFALLSHNLRFKILRLTNGITHNSFASKEDRLDARRIVSSDYEDSLMTEHDESEVSVDDWSEWYGSLLKVAGVVGGAFGYKSVSDDERGLRERFDADELTENEVFGEEGHEWESVDYYGYDDDGDDDGDGKAMFRRDPSGGLVGFNYIPNPNKGVFDASDDAYHYAELAEHYGSDYAAHDNGNGGFVEANLAEHHSAFFDKNQGRVDGDADPLASRFDVEKHAKATAQKAAARGAEEFLN
ncbi:MAG: hypothetical protein WCT36_03000 [Candidatus Gracilibacteria bacterium]|jgi:hypothetical protein